jgi:hypothetical protein
MPPKSKKPVRKKLAEPTPEQNEAIARAAEIVYHRCATQFHNSTGNYPPQAWGSFSDYLRRGLHGDDLMQIFNAIALAKRIDGDPQ